MFIDKNGRLFGKINIIDILIVVVVVAAFGGLAYKFSSRKSVSPFAAKTSTIQMEFYAESVPDFAARAVVQGNIVIDGIRNVNCGHVKSVSVGDSVYFGFSDKGEAVASKQPGYSSIRIVVEGEGIPGENGINIGGQDYFIGQTINTLKVGDAALGNVRVSAIKK